MGFTEFEIPESNWLFKMAKYIDQTNLLEVFERPVRAEPQITATSRPSSRVYHGRTHASTHLFRTAQIRQNKKLHENFKLISDTFRTLMSYKISLEVLEREVQDTRARIVVVESNLGDFVTKAAFTYTAVENPNIRPETILGGPEGLTPQMREVINGNIKL